jgi:hypothetical protein
MSFVRPSEGTTTMGEVRRPGHILAVRRGLAVMGVLFVAGALTWLALGRTEPAVVVLEVQLVATSDDGRALAGAALVIGGDTVVTASDGRARSRVRGRLGTSPRAALQCPRGHRTSSPPPRLTFATPRSATTSSTEVSVVCVRPTRIAAVLVQALVREQTTLVDGDQRRTEEGGTHPLAGAEIERDGQIIGRTDAAGFAHFALDLPPGTTSSVTVLPTAAIAMTPPRAAMPIAVTDQDDVHVVSQTFTIVREVVVPRKPKSRPRPTERPRRIQVLQSKNGAPFQEL